jgi:hypothetical protein
MSPMISVPLLMGNPPVGWFPVTGMTTTGCDVASGGLVGCSLGG